MFQFSKNKFIYIVFILFYIIVGINLSWLAGKYVYFNDMQMISNRVYTENAVTFILTNTSLEDFKILINNVQHNQILWKEDTTQIRGIYYVSGVQLPIIKGRQFDFDDKELHKKNQILAGVNIELQDDNDILGTLGYVNRTSSLDDYILYPLNLNVDTADGKWILDGINVQDFMSKILQTELSDKILLQTTKTGGAFNAYKSINIGFLYWITCLSIFVCTLIISLIWFEKKKNYIIICRYSGIHTFKIIIKVLKEEVYFILAALISGIIYSILFMPKFIFFNSIINMIFIFAFSLFINLIISCILIILKMRRWAGYDSE